MMIKMMRIRQTHLSRVTVLIPNVLIAIVQKLDAQQVCLMRMVVVEEQIQIYLITTTNHLN